MQKRYKTTFVISGLIALAVAAAIASGKAPGLHKTEHPSQIKIKGNGMKLTDPELKKKLTPEQYQVACQGSTEAPFTGKYWNEHAKGTYKCVVCGKPLFDSETKFDSGTGWPSFYKPVNKENVGEKKDTSHGMVRMEVVCNHCGAHLGHVFEDGPNPTGLRYCINSASLNLEHKEDSKDQKK